MRSLLGHLAARRQSEVSWIQDFEAAGRDAQDKVESLGALLLDGLRTGGHAGLGIAMLAFVELTNLASEIS